MKPWLVRGAWAALTVAAGLTTWLLLANREHPPRPAPSAGVAARPDYQLDQARITRYAADGSRRSILDAAQVSHYPDRGMSRLSNVLLHYFPQNHTWRLSADRGSLSDDGKRLALAGSVRAREVEVAQPMHFAAPSVLVLLDERRIRSGARVTLWRGPQKTTGTGLRADLRTGTLSLLKDVKSRYVQ